MRLLSEESIVLFLLNFLHITANEKNGFSACATGNLRVTESFRATRVAASAFPCFVSDVFLKYKPPPKMVLVMYKPLCFTVRTCFAMTPLNQLGNHRDFTIISSCFIEMWMNLTKMDIFAFYKVPLDMRNEFANEEMLRPILAGIFHCFEENGMGNFRSGPDAGIAILRWLMERLF